MLQYYNIKYALIISLVIHSFSAVSQDRDLIWPLGDKAGIDFAGDSAVPIMNLKQLNLYITNVSISDNKGNLLFYSNGIEVANSLHDVMSNGDSLSPGKYTSVYSWSGMPTCQGAMIIPKPGDSLKYYIFHLNLDSNVGGHIIPDRLFYSVVDMSLDGGLGDLTAQKNVVVLQELLVEGRIAAVKHGNGRDWWLFVHKYETDRFSRFLITPSGIKGPYSQWIGYSMDYKDDWCGQTVFSPNGDMMANILRTGKIDVFDFDRCTGDLSNWRVLSDTSYNQVLGCSFSPNGQLLYVSTQTKLFQFEVNVSNIDSTRVLIDTWDGSYSPSFPFATYFGLHQLGPDGKIYVSTWNGTDVLHVIHKPDEKGTACSFVQKSLFYGANRYNGLGLPNNPNYKLGKLNGSMCDTLTNIDNAPVPPQHISIYPNPFSIFAIIEIPETYQKEKDLSLTLYNLIGIEVRRIENITSDKIKINRDNLSPGLYFYKLEERDQIIATGKVVIQ